MYTPGLGCVHVGPCARRAIGSDTHRGSLQFAVGCVVRFSWSAWIVVKVVDGCWAVPYIVWSCARRIPLPHGGACVGSLCIPSPLAASALACWRIGAGVLACVCVLLCCLSCELPRDSLVVRFCKPCHVERRREDGAAHPAGIRRKGLCMWLADRGTPKVCDSFRRSHPPSLRAPVEGGSPCTPAGAPGRHGPEGAAEACRPSSCAAAASGRGIAAARRLPGQVGRADPGSGARAHAARGPRGDGDAAAGAGSSGPGADAGGLGR